MTGPIGVPTRHWSESVWPGPTPDELGDFVVDWQVAADPDLSSEAHDVPLFEFLAP